MNRALIPPSFVLLTGAFGLIFPSRPPAKLDQDQDEEVKIENQWQGKDSKIESEEYHRITTSEAWTALWERHTKKGVEPPKVDFARSMVLVVLVGRSESRRVDSLVGAKSDAKGIEMTFRCVESDARVKGGITSYLMVQIPASTRKLTLKSRLVSPADKVRPAPADVVVKEFEEIKH